MARSASFVPKDCLLFDECGRGEWSKGYCLMHYKRVWRGGVAEKPQRVPNGKSLKYNLEHHGWTSVSNVPELGDCWIWGGGVDSNGYGSVWHAGEGLRAHRAAYQVFVGPIPVDLMVCHACDIRNCINPKHLWLGTNQDNMNDMLSKGRGNRRKGAQVSNSKLVESDVLDIRKRYKAKEPLKSIGGRYGVTESCVWSVGTHKSWAWLDD